MPIEKPRTSPQLLWRNMCLLIFVVLTMRPGGSLASLHLEASKMAGEPVSSGKTAWIHSVISHENSALDNAVHVTLHFSLPFYVTFDKYTSNGSHPPDDVIVSSSSNYLSVTMKFNRILTTEYVEVKAAFQVDPDNSFNDDSFHHAPCKVTLSYQDEGTCSSETLRNKEMVMTHITFYSPDCEGFGALGLSTAAVQNSQVTASSSRVKKFLPYNARNNDSGWIPVKKSGRELHKAHFIQIDMRSLVNIKMVAIQGVSTKIPPEIINLVLSEDGVEWKEMKNAVKTTVDHSTPNTVTVMKGLKFKSTARFVRVVFPPFDKKLKRGAELPAYGFELYGCPDGGEVKSKSVVPKPLGIESGIIPDNQLTSSSERGPQYGAQYSRLNSRLGAGAWCAQSCTSSEYLQIDLGHVYLIRELEVQSKHGESGATNSVLSFYLEYSISGATWDYYKATGANKLFMGSPLRNLAVRHKLFFPVHAQFVRFRPNTCINKACMRVELFWYPDTDEQSPIIFARSFLVVESTHTVFICSSEVKRSKRHCQTSSDDGQTWKELPPNVLNVLAYEPTDNTLYGISVNKKTFLWNKYHSSAQWTGISGNIWAKMKTSTSLITATEVPFIPVLKNGVSEPYEALTVVVSSSSSKRKRRSVVGPEKWGSSSKEMLFKPSGASEWKKVYSWIDYPYDMKVGCLGMPCERGTCRETPNGGYKCTCFPGSQGNNCDEDIDECSSSPCSNGASCVNSVGSFSCTCAPGFTGSLCGIDIDECTTNPCSNGATCVNSVGSFSCTCAPAAGFTGSLCDEDIDECVINPCSNGASCVNSVGSFSCTCAPGFTGSLCGIDIDECITSPCINGATCVNLVGSFSCTCVPGFTGSLCDADFDECTTDPCSNGATCLNSVGSFSCTCAAGSTGTLCETDIDECVNSPCSNGASCVNSMGSFNCSCVPGFAGALCETEVDECISNPCVYGTCVDGLNQYSCSCQLGYTGSQCQFDTTCLTSNPCLNGGTCVSTHGGGYSCNCTFFYGGDNCQLDYFLCMRLPTYSFDFPHWTNTGKFDKIAFSVNSDHYLLGMAVSSTIDKYISTQITIKLTTNTNELIALKTTQHAFGSSEVDLFVPFEQPVLLTAGVQYILASKVEGPGSPSLVYNSNGAPTLQCTSLLTISFSEVSPEEMADSNGSTVSEGQVALLYFKPV